MKKLYIYWGEVNDVLAKQKHGSPVGTVMPMQWSSHPVTFLRLCDIKPFVGYTFLDVYRYFTWF